MDIDERIEQQVREAFAAAVGEERARFEAALDGFSDQDAPQAWAYAAYVVGYVINDVLPDGATDKELDGIAQRAIGTVSGWFDLGDKAAVKALLKSASEGNVRMPGVPADQVVDMTFVLGSYLLQSYRADDEEWWEYLSTIWAAAEATPEPTD